jgi:hypothetical protein
MICSVPPGAGAKIAPRLLSEIGDDRDRFRGDVQELQCPWRNSSGDHALGSGFVQSGADRSPTRFHTAPLQRWLQLPHFDPSGFAASAIFTAEPSMMESDGSRITASSDVNPDNTSTLLP